MANASGVLDVSAGEISDDPAIRLEDGVCVAWILASSVDAGCKAGADSSVALLSKAVGPVQAAGNINSRPRKTNH
jgi:hypothetical protein